MKKWALSLFLVLFSSKILADDRLQVEVRPSNVPVLSAPLSTCENEITGLESNPQIQAPSFQFPNLKMTWLGEGKLRLISVRFKFSSEALVGKKYQCQLQGNELAAIFGNRNAFDPEVDHENSCSLRCGGLAIRSDISSAVISGKMLVLGSELTIDGVRPVSAEIPISLQY